MSQVKKLQSGGTTPPKGKFRMNGRELDGQTAIDRMSSLYGQMPLDEREMFTVAQRAILDGNIAEYDPTDNTIRVYDKNGNSLLNSYTDTKATTKDSGWKKFWDATLNTESHRFKKSGRPLAMMDMSDPAEVAAAAAELDALRRGSGWWIYDKGTDGKLTYRKDSATNQQKMNLLDSLASTFPSYASVADLKKKFTTKNWNDQDLETLVNYYQSKGSEMPAYIEKLKSRIQSNELDPSDIEFLNLHGFIEDDEAKAAKQAAAEEAAARENDPLRVDSGWKGDLDKLKAAGLGARYKDGKWYITGTNKDFTDHNWYLGGVDWAKGTDFEKGFIVNGRLYSEDEAYHNPGDAKDALAKWFAARNAKDWRSRYDIWANSGFRFINDRTGHENDTTPYYGAFNTRFNPETDYAPIWYRYFSGLGNGNYDINDVTGYFDNIGDKQIISFVDPTRAELNGMYRPRFAVYDPKENKIYQYENEDLMAQGLGLTPSSNIWTTSNPFEYNNWQNVNGTDYANYKTFGPVGQTNTIWIDRNGKLYLGRADAVSGDLVDPRAITNSAALHAILSDPKKYEKLTNADIESLLFSETGNPRLDAMVDAATSGPFVAGIKGIRALTKDYPIDPTKEQEYYQLLRDYYNNDGLLTAKGREAWKKALATGGFWMFALGGKMPKLQFGGSNDVSYTVATKTKDITESPTDITKFHKINGKDGGLTEAEWMQIGAACGDLAGVAATFIPGVGNIAGGTIGVASSLTRFAGDIKQDGYQGRDLKNLGINLLLDAASFIPFAGTFAATSKVARVIKGCKPILKVLAMAGAGGAAINAAKKIVNGEDWTSADVVQTVQGLASAGILGAGMKSKFNSAKLAQKVEAKALERAAQTAAKPKVGSAGGYEMQKTAEEVATMVNGKTKAEAIKAVQEAAKSEKSIELKEDDAAKILKDFGVDLDVKGKLQWKLPWKKGAFTRGEGKLDYATPEVPTGTHSALHYYLSSKARAKMLGSENVYGFRFKSEANPTGLFARYRQRGQLDLLTPEEVRQSLINVASKSITSNSADRALARIVAENPASFGNMFVRNNGQFTPLKAYNTWTWGGTRYWRPIIKRPKFQLETSKVLALPEKTAQGNFLRNLEWNKARLEAGNAPFVFTPRTGIPHAISNGNISKPNYYIEFWKKGGKIYRAQNGFSTDWLNNWRDKINNQDYSVGFKMPKVQVSGGVDFIKSPIGGPDIMINKGPLTFTNPTKASSDKPTTTDWMTGKTITNPDAEKLFTSNESSTVSEQEVSGQKGGKSAGGSWDEVWRINKPNLDDLLRAGVTIAGINKDKRLQRRALEELKKRQFLTPHMDKINYNFSDIERGYDSASEPIKNASLQTSSLRDAMAFELSKSQKLSDIQATKSANISKRMMDIDEANRKINAANNSAEVATANEKSKYLTNLEYQDRMLDSQALNRIFSNVINPLGQQFSQQGRTAWKMQGQAEYESDMDAAQQHALRKMQVSIPENIKTAWNKLTAAEKNNYNNDIATYLLEKDPTKYASIMNTVNNTLKLARRNATANYRDYIGPNLSMRSRQWVPESITQEAKGGKISTSKNMRDAQEQIAINGDKEAKRAAQKLSDHLMRMLSQLIK